MAEKTNGIILVGGFHEVIELCELQDISITGIIDIIRTVQYMGYRILGTDQDAEDLFKIYRNHPLIINLDKPEIRSRIAEKYHKIGYQFTNLISSNSAISKSVQCGNGVFIQRLVNISMNVTIGNHVRINTMANIMHDSMIGDFSTIAPNAVILGNVKIGCQSYIGANSTILPGITIGNKTIIGAGSVVTKDVHDGMTVVGNPARKLEREI